MKWNCCTIVLNEIHYLPYWLKSVYDFADNVIIVEGATKYVKNELKTKDGLSVDGTTEFIKEYINTQDKSGKLTYVPLGNCLDKRDLQNRALKEVERLGGGWILIQGADEMMHRSDLDKLKKLTEDDKYLRHIMLHNKYFFGDWEHRLHITPEYHASGQKFTTDKHGKHMLIGHTDERCFYFRKGMRYTGDSFLIRDEQSRVIMNHEAYKKHRLISDIWFYHYSLIEPISDIREKLDYYKRRTNTNYFNPKNNKIIRYLLDTPEEFKKKFNKFGIYEESLDSHPEYMKEHKWFGKNVFEISNEEDIKWLKSLK